MSAVVIDSSFYIQGLRQRMNLPGVLSPWLIHGQLFQCGIIRVEVLRGIREIRQREQMAKLFQVAREVTLSPAFWDQVMELAWRLDRDGVVMPMPDLAIAQCALQHDAVLVTLDDDYRHIPGLSWSRTLPAS